MPAVTTFYAIPSRFAAGTTVSYRRAHAEYPASAWNLKLWLNGASAASADAVADGDTFVITLSAAVTAALQAGLYDWTERVTSKTPGGPSYDAAKGRSIVTPDVATAAAGELQSDAEKTLKVLRARRDGKLSKDQESIQIDGIAVMKIPFKDIDRIITKYENAVTRERNGGSLIRVHRVRFGSR